MSNVQQALNTKVGLHSLTGNKPMLSKLDLTFHLKEKNLIDRIVVKNTDEGNCHISLTMSKSEFDDYSPLLNQLLKNRDFCSRNVENFESLTCREREILLHVLNGLKTVEIADCLFLSVETVKTHRKNILAKLSYPNVYKLSQYLIFFNQ